MSLKKAGILFLLGVWLTGSIKAGPFTPREETSQQQLIKVSGTIVDKERNPLPGVNVMIKGTYQGTITDMDGHFYLDVPSRQTTLTVTYIGFKQQEVTVGNSINFNLILQEDVEELDEVVVVGYGSQKKISVVGSVMNLEPAKLQSSTSRSISNNLAGQLAGVIGVQRSGEPGYDNSNIWIRGLSSFAGSTSPLVLVDGIERSLNDMDPAEIESFSILKDAAASAMYGVRGANGVILINTKRGEIGKPKVSVRVEQSITAPTKFPDFLGAVPYMELMNNIARENGTPQLFSEDRIHKTRIKYDPDLYPDVDWVDAITKDHATSTRANLSINGGSEIIRYSLVGSYFGESGLIARDKSQDWDSSTRLNRFNIRSNVDINMTRTTQVRINIGGYLQNLNKASGGVGDLFKAAFETPPFVHPTIYSNGKVPRVVGGKNPWAIATQRGYERSSHSKIESLFSIEQNLRFILPGLKAKVNFSFDSYQKNAVYRDKDPDYYSPATERDDDGELMLSIQSKGKDFLGYSQKPEYGNTSTYFEANISYSNNFGKNFVEGLFLYNQREYDDGSKQPYRNQGIAGRLSYSFDRRYIAEFNFGYNGSENFAPGKRFGFFPSVAVGYLLSEEKFMESYKNTFNKIKLRVSHGLVGNDQIKGRRFAYITTIGSSGDYYWGANSDTKYSGRQEGDQGVENLTWETVAKTNIGLELGLFNQFDLQVDVFNENRKNIFMQRKTIPGSAGFATTPWANFGKVNNKGVDMAVDYHKQFHKNLFVSFRGTFTYAHNKIKEYDEPASVVGTYRSETGHSINALQGLFAMGLFTDDDFIDVEMGILKEGIPVPTFTDRVRPGDIRYKDMNGDGIIDELDKGIIGGTKDPQVVYGFGSNINFKRFDFGFFFQGVAQSQRIIGGDIFLPGSGSGSRGNIYSNVYDRWTPENPAQDVFYPRLYTSVNGNNEQPSTWWKKNSAFLRLKNIELGYSIPKSPLAKAKIQRARIFVSASNILCFSPFKLWDPEVGRDNGLMYPGSKSVMAGLELNF